jgi:hypothetical protein
MYQHFAVITVAITAILAVFADGEEKEAIEAQIAKRQAKNELMAQDKALAEKGKGGNNSQIAFKDNRQQKGSFGSDATMSVTTNYSEESFGGGPGSDAPGGNPMDRVASGSGEAELPDRPPPGLTPEANRDYERELERRKKNRQPSKASIERMIEASKARSQTRSMF